MHDLPQRTTIARLPPSAAQFYFISIDRFNLDCLQIGTRGVGEPAVTVVAPALANAIFNAVGARVRALPITAEAVKGAMRA